MSRGRGASGWFASAVILSVLAVSQVPYETNRAHETPQRMFGDSLTFQGDYSIYFSFVQIASTSAVIASSG